MRSLSLVILAVVFGCSEPDAAIDDPCNSPDDRSIPLQDLIDQI
jgi:hypothetical protein